MSVVMLWCSPAGQTTNDVSHGDIEMHDESESVPFLVFDGYVEDSCVDEAERFVEYHPVPAEIGEVTYLDLVTSGEWCLLWYMYVASGVAHRVVVNTTIDQEVHRESCFPEYDVETDEMTYCDDQQRDEVAQRYYQWLGDHTTSDIVVSLDSDDAVRALIADMLWVSDDVAIWSWAVDDGVYEVTVSESRPRWDAVIDGYLVDLNQWRVTASPSFADVSDVSWSVDEVRRRGRVNRLWYMTLLPLWQDGDVDALGQYVEFPVAMEVYDEEIDEVVAAVRTADQRHDVVARYLASSAMAPGCATNQCVLESDDVALVHEFFRPIWYTVWSSHFIDINGLQYEYRDGELLLSTVMVDSVW